MLMSAMRQLHASTDAKSSQLFAGAASFSRHIRKLYGPSDVGHRTGRRESGVST